MRTIGLVGGMSWESTAVYYRLLNEAVRARLGGLASAEIAMRSVDFARIVALQTSGRWDLAADALAAAARGLERAGADCILICTNTMHLVADEVAAAVGVPLIHIVDETAAAIRAEGGRRPLLLATRYTMEHGFYAARMARHGLDVVVPDADDRQAIHAIIFDELCRGVVTPASRDRALAIVERGRAAGADSVILGCTEICLLLDPAALPLPGFDSTAIHTDAALRFALGEETAAAAA
ncbi:aspartate/glutamate racemase family protein [Oharaeibacter diazotrophicus]|uniref:Aspartate racemase n=1 Tax=Oharaeibacter diazotrophicus TaxID=1920512 RepID=A0A4R6RID5_9HYPH|nr:aspartate/glutamate racemase family protein [Oharaeibacter diazotrophicus]TDP85627.1 aspartate racemase [Oharaeibacter diazotrophicus]BBE74593.1 putative amino-acid racemase [Pleomorphomonas sp. SM30]GLS75702.1 aspartate racemase [Oharaeibacter diazotrophicus]